MLLVRYMKRSVSESKPFQSSSKVEIPVRARREGRLSRSKLNQVFLIDSDAELFMYLIQCIRFGSGKVQRLNRALHWPVFFKEIMKQDLLFYFVSFVRRGKLNTEKPKWDRGKEMA